MQPALICGKPRRSVPPAGLEKPQFWPSPSSEPFAQSLSSLTEEPLHRKHKLVLNRALLDLSFYKTIPVDDLLYGRVNRVVGCHRAALLWLKTGKERCRRPLQP